MLFCLSLRVFVFTCSALTLSPAFSAAHPQRWAPLKAAWVILHKLSPFTNTFFFKLSSLVFSIVYQASFLGEEKRKNGSYPLDTLMTKSD